MSLNLSSEASVLDPIVESHRRLIDAFLKGDVPAIVALYSDSAVMMPPNEPSLFGRKEIEEWHQEYFKAFRLVTADETEREVTRIGEWAVERWSYLVAIQSLSSPDRIRDDGRFLSIWKQEAGVWRIAQSMFNSIRPVGSGTSRFLVRLKMKADA